MTRKPLSRENGPPNPTPAELRILQYLWDHGPCTVRDVFLGHFDPTETAYTTVLKLMQIMHGKGLLTRDDSARAHVYEAVNPREQTQQVMLKDFVTRVYRGSSAKLVLQALGATQPASSKELGEIRRFLDEIEQKQRGG